MLFRSVYAAMAALEADQSNSVYVGDSEVDVATAANAGIPCLSVTWGFRDPEWLSAHGATELVDSVEGLGDAILAG